MQPPPARPAAPPSLPGSDPATLAAIGEAVRTQLAATPRAVRIASDKLDIYAVKDFLSPPECAALVALIDADVKPSTSLRSSTGPRRRTSETCKLPATDPLVSAVEQRMEALLGQPLSHSETVQGQRYHPGQEFKVHNDYFAAGHVYSAAVAREGGQRTWTAMVYLDAPAKGGSTQFPMLGIAIPPRAGVLLLWNNLDRDGRPNPFSHHAGTIVEAGVKHVLTKWFREREWQGSTESDALRV